MAHHPIEFVTERRARPAGTPSPFGVDLYSRGAALPGPTPAGDGLSLSEAARSRIPGPVHPWAASGPVPGAIPGRDLARLARGEIRYEAYLAQRRGA